MTDTHDHSWIQTYTGKKFYPMDPDPHAICIEDIAHALSMKCRYNGHASPFYSVANHSIIVSNCVSDVHALWGLMHDAGEAYLPDVPRPIKRLPEFQFLRDAEARIMRAVCQRFGMDPDEPPNVKQVDGEMIALEERSFMCAIYSQPGAIITADMPDIIAMSSYEAKSKFLERFRELIGGS